MKKKKRRRRICVSIWIIKRCIKRKDDDWDEEITDKREREREREQKERKK